MTKPDIAPLPRVRPTQSQTTPSTQQPHAIPTIPPDQTPTNIYARPYQRLQRRPTHHRVTRATSRRKEVFQANAAQLETLLYAKLINGPNKTRWNKSACNKFGRLAQGYCNGNIKGTNTFFHVTFENPAWLETYIRALCHQQTT